MRISASFRVLGLLLMLFSLTMLVPLFVSIIYEDGEHLNFIFSLLLTFGGGVLIWLPTARSKRDLSTRDGFLITSLFWTVLGIFGSLPFYLTDTLSHNGVDAIFESISGLTTTGATVYTGLDKLPESILFYRQFLQWIGGIGIVVIAVAILPMLGVGGMQLYRAETPGPVKDNKMTPRITSTAKALFLLYVTLTAMCAAAYWIAGMSGFDAICHSFSTIAIGGFSTHDASMGHFDNPLLWMLSSIFMFAAAINFAHHFFWWNTGSIKHYFRDSETKFYSSILFLCIVITCGYLYYTGTFDASDSIYHGIFQAVSITTTTGYVTTDFSIWPTFLPMMLLLCAVMGGCAGSTGGGAKAVRVMLIFKQGARELKQLVHPNAVIPLKLGKNRVPASVVSAVWSFMAVYMMAFLFIMLLLQATGLDYITSFSATAGTINNLGPGLGDVTSHYGDISNFAKLVLCFSMLLGRLEIFTLLVLFTPTFWRR